MDSSRFTLFPSCRLPCSDRNSRDNPWVEQRPAGSTTTPWIGDRHGASEKIAISFLREPPTPSVPCRARPHGLFSAAIAAAEHRHHDGVRAADIRMASATAPRFHRSPCSRAAATPHPARARLLAAGGLLRRQPRCSAAPHSSQQASVRLRLSWSPPRCPSRCGGRVARRGASSAGVPRQGSSGELVVRDRSAPYSRCRVA